MNVTDILIKTDKIKEQIGTRVCDTLNGDCTKCLFQQKDCIFYEIQEVELYLKLLREQIKEISK